MFQGALVVVVVAAGCHRTLKAVEVVEVFITALAKQIESALCTDIVDALSAYGRYVQSFGTCQDLRGTCLVVHKLDCL